MGAREFFERRERAFRPAVVLLVARAVESTEKGKPVSARQCLLAEIVEMMCTATIVHDSVLEDDEESMLGNVAHRTYSQNAGNKVSVLAGDFLLARCSVALATGRLDGRGTDGYCLRIHRARWRFEGASAAGRRRAV